MAEQQNRKQKLELLVIRREVTPASKLTSGTNSDGAEAMIVLEAAKPHCKHIVRQGRSQT